MSNRHAKSWRQPAAGAIAVRIYDVSPPAGVIYGDPWTFSTEHCTLIPDPLFLGTLTSAGQLLYFTGTVVSGGVPPYTWTWDTLTSNPAGTVLLDPTFTPTGTQHQPNVLLASKDQNLLTVEDVLQQTTPSQGVMRAAYPAGPSTSATIRFHVVDAVGTARNETLILTFL